MKKYLFLFVMALLTFGYSTVSKGQLLLEENFAYPVGELLTAHGWTNHSGASNFIAVTAASITYTNYLSSGIGDETALVASGEDVNRTFSSQTTGSMYASFIVKVTAMNTTGDYFFHLGPTTLGSTFRGRVFVKKDASDNLAFGISYASGTAVYTPFTYSLNTTYLIVLKYTIVAGTSNDVVSIFIDPILGATEPLPTATATDINTDPVDIGTVALRQGTNSPALKLDGIRIGLTWADVTGTGTIIAPTTQSSNFTFNNILQTQMDVAWTNGNGTKRVVKINTTNSFTIPADGTDPAANAVYGGSGEQVIFNGSGNTVPIVSGLTANTTYWFQAWEYNGTGTNTMYCSVAGANNPLSQTTAATATPPVISSPTATSVTATSAILGGDITADGGAPILERGTVWATVPGVTIADNKLAEGGTTTGIFTHTRTGMPANTPIYYAAYATNSAGTTLTTESSFTTLLGEPTNHAASFAANSYSYSSLVTTWLDNDGLQPATGFLVMGNTTGVFIDPVDGVQPTSDPGLGDGSGFVYVNHGLQTFTWTALYGSTPYYFKIYAYTNTGTNIDYKTVPDAPTATTTTLVFVNPTASWTFDSTYAAPLTPSSVAANFGEQSATAMLFADGTNGSSAWTTATSLNELTMFGGTTTNDPREGTAIYAGGSYCPVGGTGLSSNGKSMVIKFSMSALQDPILTFATRGTATGFNNHQWAWSTDGTAFTDFGTNTAVNTSTFITQTLDMNTIDALDGAPVVYLRITFTGAASATGNNRLDNIVIRASAATTLAPTVVTNAATLVEATTATLNGTVNANNQSSAVNFEYGTTPGTYGPPVPGVPAIVTGGTINAITADLTGLSQNTTYYYRITATNGSGTSNGSELFFTTGCLPTGDAGQISGPSTVYADGTTQYQYTVPAITNATNYIWSFPAPYEIVLGDGTNTVTVIFFAGATSGNVSVFGLNACDVEGNMSEYAISIFTVPANLSVAETITAGNAICYNATYTITVAGNSTIFEIMPNGSAGMKAGHNILYLPGTIVHEGGFMTGVIVPNGPYCSGKAPVVIESIEEAGLSLMNNTFKIFPNPTTGVFSIEQRGETITSQVRVEVLGPFGGNILTTELQPVRKQEVSIKGNPPGIYFVKLTAGEKVQTVKVILTN